MEYFVCRNINNTHGVHQYTLYVYMCRALDRQLSIGMHILLNMYKYTWTKMANVLLHFREQITSITPELPKVILQRGILPIVKVESIICFRFFLSNTYLVYLRELSILLMKRKNLMPA